MTREHGYVATELVAALGLLLLPVVLVVVSVPVWSEVQSMGRVAAQQAARAAVLAPDDAAARAAATTAAGIVAANHGRSLAGPVRLEATVDRSAGTLGTQQLVTATVPVELPAVPLPLLADLTAVTWEVSHTQPVDPYRSVP